MEFATKFLSKEHVTALEGAGFTSEASFCVKADSKEAVVEHLARQVLKVGDGESWQFQPAACSLRAMLEQLSREPEKEAAGAQAGEKADTSPLELSVKRGAKVDAAKRASLIKDFETKFGGCPCGSRRTAPGNRLLERCLDMCPGGKDEPGVYLAPGLCKSQQDEEAGFVLGPHFPLA